MPTFAYIPNSVSNDVSVLDTATGNVVATIPVGTDPRGVAVNSQSVTTRVYVTNFMSNNVSVIDTATNTVVATIPVGTNPYGVAVSPDTTRVYVANQASNTVSVIDASTNLVITTISVGIGINPLGIVVNPAGTRVYVANTGSGTVSVIDTSSNLVIATILIGGALDQLVGVAINPAGTRLYVTHFGTSQISVIDTATNLPVVLPINVGLQPFGIAVTPNGAFAYYVQFGNGRMNKIDTATNLVVNINVSIGANNVGISITPDGTRVYVPSPPTNNVYVTDTSTDTNIPPFLPVGNTPFSLGIFIGFVQSQPTLITQASPSVALGGMVNDVATLSGGTNPTGTITFSLYGPNDATCSILPVFTSIVPVIGNGVYPSTSFAPLAIGTYRWIANYSGDVNNLPVINVCNADNESVIVTSVPLPVNAGRSGGGAPGFIPPAEFIKVPHQLCQGKDPVIKFRGTTYYFITSDEIYCYYTKNAPLHN